jgi:hypothetical protein
MPYKFILYATAVLLAFAYANANGYVYASYLMGQGTASKSANHYHK